MARPETTRDVEDRMEFFASFEIDKISTTAALLKHYTALLEANEKAGGTTEVTYNSVRLYRPKTESELKTRLEQDQRTWDRHRDLYFKAVKADHEADEIKEYEKDYIKEWARKEHKPDPFDVFAANDPDLQEIRKSLGMVD